MYLNSVGSYQRRSRAPTTMGLFTTYGMYNINTIYYVLFTTYGMYYTTYGIYNTAYGMYNTTYGMYNTMYYVAMYIYRTN